MAVARKEIGSRPVKLQIVDVQVKDQVCIIKASCADGSSYHIYRHFKNFQEMLSALEKRFPIEAGAISRKDRTLPYLYIPGKKIIGWTAVKDRSDKRLPTLNTFLQNIYALPDNIRYDSIVSHFSTSSHNDLLQPLYTPSEAALNAIPLSSSSTNGSVARTSPRANRKPSTGIDGTVTPTYPNCSPPICRNKTVTSTSPRTNRRPPTRPQAPTQRPTHQPPEISHQPPETCRVSPGLPLPTPKSDRVSPGLSLPTSKSGRVSPGLPLPTPKSGRVSPGLSLPTPKSGRVSPGPSLPPRPPRPQSSGNIGKVSDELASSDTREESGKGLVTYYYNGSTKTVEMESSVFTRPSYVQLFNAIQKQLRTEKLVLNYKDRDGDLVQLCEQEDMELLACEATHPGGEAGRARQAPWAIYVTKEGDISVYNTLFPPNPRPH